VLTVIKGESCHDICSVSSVQLVVSSPRWLLQGVLSVSGIYTVGRICLGAIVPYHDMPLLLESSCQSGQSSVLVVVVGGVSWGMCVLVSMVSMMHATVFRCCAADVIDRVIRCCGIVIRSVCGLWEVLVRCWCGGGGGMVTTAMSCRSGVSCDGCCSAAYLKLLSASSRVSTVVSLSRWPSEWL
jgi:hypothetical protein